MTTTASAYWLSQGARVGWYLSQYLISHRLSVLRGARAKRVPRRGRSNPGVVELLRDILALFARDRDNIRLGLYAAPDDFPAELPRLVEDAMRYFRDFPEVDERRRRGGTEEVRQVASLPIAGLPDYYLRNFHYQTDGYLSPLSAALYDQQVEVLFMGSAGAMRRQALVPIASWLRRSRIACPRHLDVACGTGAFLRDVRRSFPRLRSIGLDLSLPYLARARRPSVAGSDDAAAPEPPLVCGLAERLPIADASIDILTCVYLLHEVPDDVRHGIAGEFARVLRPGGRLVLVDSLQYGDRPAWDGLLAAFPKSFHEPYYAAYAGCDLNQAFAAHGLRPLGAERAFLSKVVSFAKPEDGPGLAP